MVRPIEPIPPRCSQPLRGAARQVLADVARIDRFVENLKLWIIVLLAVIAVLAGLVLWAWNPFARPVEPQIRELSDRIQKLELEALRRR